MLEELRGRMVAKLDKEQPTSDGLYRHECEDIVDVLLPLIEDAINEDRGMRQLRIGD